MCKYFAIILSFVLLCMQTACGQTEGNINDGSITSNKMVKGDIALNCTFSDGSGSQLIIYSKNQKIEKIGSYKNLDWRPDHTLIKKGEDNSYIFFELISDFVDPSSGYKSSMVIDRSSLALSIKSSLPRNGETRSQMACSTLSDDLFSDIIGKIKKNLLVKLESNKI